jgi:hypothetical protein
MATAEPLIPKAKAGGRSKASIFYNADEYMDELKAKYETDHEIASLMGFSPDGPGGGPAAAKGDKMTSIQVTDEKRSLSTNRLWPESNKPDPMPKDLAFMFTKISPEQMIYMWRWYTGVFICQCLCPVAYALFLRAGMDFWLATTIVGIFAWQVGIQNVYILHDVLHGATFPPYWWQEYITHAWADFISLPWTDIVMEHMKHHSSTVDLLIHGEFGWDPSTWLYWPNDNKWEIVFGHMPGKCMPIFTLRLFEYEKLGGKDIIHPKTAWKKELVPWASLKLAWITMPLVLPWHFFGANDTGALFAGLWYSNFPVEGAGGKCNKDFWGKWFVRRVKHTAFVWSLWACVYCIGTQTELGGLKFLLIIAAMHRAGFSSAWIFIVNFNHSESWNHFLATDPDRRWEMLHSVMALVLGGRHRWNEILFHDLHHAFPNAVGTMSQRGRFNGWQAVRDAAVKILARGLFKSNGDQETQMQQNQRKRSIRAKESTKA